MIPQIILVFIGCFTLALGYQFNPVPFTLPSPPDLSGALRINNDLATSEILHWRQVSGPRSFAFLNGNVYAVTTDWKVVNIAMCYPQVIVNFRPQFCYSTATCGALVSIRVGINGQLLVMDAVKGLYEVNPVTGAVKLLFSGTTIVGARRPVYLNDMVQASDGTIYMSDSSDKFVVFQEVYIIMEGAKTGRILALDPTTGVARVFQEYLAFPDGVELTSDGRALLVAESGRARVLSISLDPLAGQQVSIFANNLPGCPTNIRRSTKGTFWIGLALIRHSGIPNSMDQYSNNPQARLRTLLTDSLQQITSYYSRHGMVVELNPSGIVIKSLHDPLGWAFPSVSEAAENDGLLYIGYPNTVYVGRVVLNTNGVTVLSQDSGKQFQRSRCMITEEEYQNYWTNKTQTTGATTGTTTTGTVTTGTTTTATTTIGTVAPTTTELVTTTAQP